MENALIREDILGLKATRRTFAQCDMWLFTCLRPTERLYSCINMKQTNHIDQKDTVCLEKLVF